MNKNKVEKYIEYVNMYFLKNVKHTSILHFFRPDQLHRVLCLFHPRISVALIQQDVRLHHPQLITRRPEQDCSLAAHAFGRFRNDGQHGQDGTGGVR